MRTKLRGDLLAIDRELDDRPEDAALYMERGKLYNKIGEMDKALNDFIRVGEIDPDNDEAKEYVSMITDILEYRYRDIYNP